MICDFIFIENKIFKTHWAKSADEEVRMNLLMRELSILGSLNLLGLGAASDKGA